MAIARKALVKRGVYWNNDEFFFPAKRFTFDAAWIMQIGQPWWTSAESFRLAAAGNGLAAAWPRKTKDPSATDLHNIKRSIQSSRRGRRLCNLIAGSSDFDCYLDARSDLGAVFWMKQHEKKNATLHFFNWWAWLAPRPFDSDAVFVRVLPVVGHIPTISIIKSRTSVGCFIERGGQRHEESWWESCALCN